MTWPLLAPLSPEERARVLAAARVRRYAKGEVVCHEGDPGEHVHLVRSGHLAVRKALPSGESATLSLVAPGESFGELALLGERRARTASVVALEASETLTLSRADFLGIRRQSGVDALLLEALVARVDQLSGALLEALYVGVDRRVIRRLVELAEMYPDTDQGHPVVPLTQDDLAGLAGATRPTVNQVLRRLATDRAVSLERGRIHVLDLEALRRRSGQ